MKINIYDQNGYVDMKSIIEAGYTFTIIIGGRGTGKTFGALLYVLEERKPFILMRRTQKQTDKIAKPEFTPFKAVTSYRPDLKVIARKSDDIGTINRYHYEDEEIVIDEPPAGYVCALSTISNLRGFDASDVELLIYDEFIPERHEKALKAENEAILNAYETINRNRELQERKPLQLVALANSNRVDNALLEAFGLVNIAYEMTTGKRPPVYANRQRGILLITLQESPISKRKSYTALYQATAGSDFNRMALSNEFAGTSFENVHSENLSQYDPIVTIGEMTIYRHKSEYKYYASAHRCGDPPVFGTDEIDIKRFRRSYPRLWFNYIERNNVIFENAALMTLFEKYYTM